MEMLATLLFFGAITFFFIGAFTSIQKATFISLLGLFLILISPLAASAITSSVPTFETWTGTFRILGICVFVWGLVESVLTALRPKIDSKVKNDGVQVVWNREDEKTTVR